jgi:hypothetical protein
MTRSKRSRVLIATMAVLALVAAFPQPAAANSRVGVRGGRPVIIRGFYGWPRYGFGWGPYFSPFYGSYYGPYYGPYGARPEGGIDMNVAVLAGLGAVNVHVKPGEAEVWADGKFVAEARDLDGYPSYLWLAEGVHRVAVYRGGYARFEEDIDVHRGVVEELKVRLVKGESVPPGERPGKSRSY